MAAHVAGLRDRGIDARAIDLPRGRAERAIPRFASLLTADPTLAVGGHSFGGRVASLAAAEQPARALVLFSYPLHAPGRPGATLHRMDDREARTRSGADEGHALLNERLRQAFRRGSGGRLPAPAPEPIRVASAPRARVSRLHQPTPAATFAIPPDPLP